LHGCGEFSVRSAELLEQHIAKTRIRLADANSEHELLDVMIHIFGDRAPGLGNRLARVRRSPAEWTLDSFIASFF
jgi:hypothetical protein